MLLEQTETDYASRARPHTELMEQESITELHHSFMRLCVHYTRYRATMALGWIEFGWNSLVEVENDSVDIIDSC